MNAGNPTVFARAQDLGLSGTELAEQVEADTGLMRTLEQIRCAGAVAMGLARDAERVHRDGRAGVCLATIRC